MIISIHSSIAMTIHADLTNVYISRYHIFAQSLMSPTQTLVCMLDVTTLFKPLRNRHNKLSRLDGEKFIFGSHQTNFLLY